MLEIGIKFFLAIVQIFVKDKARFNQYKRKIERETTKYNREVSGLAELRELEREGRARAVRRARGQDEDEEGKS